jgi:hypothetical protein
MIHVAICLPVYDTPKMPFWAAFERMDKPDQYPSFPGLTTVLHEHGQLTVYARTTLTTRALRLTPEVTHLLWLDADIVPPKDLLPRLLARHCDVVGALYRSRRPPWDPVARWTDSDGQLRRTSEPIPPGIHPVTAVGAGAMLVERRVFERMEDGVWWRPTDGLSEDFAFCARARAEGFGVFLDADVDCGHVAEVVVDAEFARRMRA